MKKIGQFLKNEREKQGLSLEEISSKIKVHNHKLKAIEENWQDELPARVFIIGLIKSYAKELKLDIQEVDKLCKELYKKDELSSDETDEVHLNNKDKIPQFQWFGLFQIPKKIAVGISLFIIFLLLIIILIIVKETNIHQKPRQEKTDIHQKSLKMETDDHEKSLDNVLDVEKEKDIKNPSNLEKKTKPVKKKFKTPEQKKTSFNLNNKLIIKALRPIQVEVIWSDGSSQKISLTSQEVKTFIFLKPIRIKISDGSSALLSFNGENKKIPGNSNEPVELAYP